MKWCSNMILTITTNPAIDKVYSVSDYKIGGVFRPDSMTETAGGKGLNVARVASLLGEEVTATGFIGGSTGEFIERGVKEQGILSRFVHINGISRICIAVMDKKNNTSTEILEPGPMVSEDEINRFIEQYKALLDECDIVTASGSLPEGAPVDFYRCLIEEARTKGKKFILDTSGKYFKAGVEGLPFMIKPNVEEMEKVLGRPLESIKDKAEALMEFKEMGITLPCMTLGKDGAIAYLSDGAYHFTAPELKVVNTVGSGDSFIAGCASGLNRGIGYLESVRLGMACGMANTQFFKTGMISLELVDKYLKVIKVEKLY